MTNTASEPRVFGYAEPRYIELAKIAFLDVLRAARKVEAPDSGAYGPTELAENLERAVKVAEEYCNTELKRRLLAYQDAVIENSMRADHRTSTTAARDHFALGCRIALGTN